MREIKFRAWNKKEKFLDTAWSIDFEHELVCHRTHNQSNLLDCELTQYIGLNNFTGTNIYEGDIVRRDFEIYQTESSGSLENDSLEVWTETIADGYFIGVVHQTPRGLFVLNNCKKYDAEGNFIKKCSGIQLHARHCRVIGNVFENRELLEELI